MQRVFFKGFLVLDVGSRGLDIPQVELVLNYEVPANTDDYIHRIGRTARAGRGGLALSFVTEKDVDIVLSLEAKINKKLEAYPVQENAILDILNQVSLAKRTASLYLEEKQFGKKQKINKMKKQRLM